MSNSYFQFKQFTIQQDRSAMKVTTDGCLFGAWVAEEVKNQKSKIKNVLDIGTGTGLLSLMFAQKNPTAVIDAIEIDKDAFEQAKENIDVSPWKDRINIKHGDAKIFSFHKKYDRITSNPPFYENELKSPGNKKNIAHHSDDLSLNELLIVTKKLLADNGKFFFLFSYKRKQDIEEALNFHSLFVHQLILLKQSTQHDYFRIIIEGGLQKRDEVVTKEISIWDHQKQYTDEFTYLLKDYYLYL